MDVDRERKLESIKEQIERGTYRVDPKAVADAILCRLFELAGASHAGPAAGPSAGPSAERLAEASAEPSAEIRSGAVIAHPGLFARN